MSAAVRYIEAAKIEELTATLEGEGYQVVGVGNGEESKYDLIAVKDQRKIAVEVVARSSLRDAQTVETVSRLREQAYQQGFAEFRLVIVSPPRETTVEIAGLETLLFEEMANNLPAELDSLSTQTRLTGVSNIAVQSVAVTASALRVVGSGVVAVELEFAGGEARDGMDREIDFPFTFDALLNRDLQLEEVMALSVDTTSFSY